MTKSHLFTDKPNSRINKRIAFLMDQVETGTYKLQIICKNQSSQTYEINYCKGCKVNNVCIDDEYGRYNNQYCYYGSLKSQKEHGIDCDINEICISNYCHQEKNICMPKNLLSKIWWKISLLFKN